MTDISQNQLAPDELRAAFSKPCRIYIFIIPKVKHVYVFLAVAMLIFTFQTSKAFKSLHILRYISKRIFRISYGKVAGVRLRLSHPKLRKGFLFNLF
jgi:hypothetical protein